MGLLTHLKTGQKYAGPVGPWHPPIGDLEDAAGNNGSARPSLNDPSMEYFTVDSTIQNFRYTYDNMGRLTQRTQKNSQFETFQYDNMDRLTSFTQGTLNGSSQTFTTTYDSQGNILSNTLAGTYRYDSNKPHAVTKVTPSTNFPNAISAADCLTEYNVFNQRDKWSWSVRLNFWAKAFDWLQFTVAGNYTSPTLSLMSERKARYWLNFGLRSDLFKRKLSIFVNVQDIFNWGARFGSGSVNTNPYFLNNSTNKMMNSRYVSAGITLRFGKMELEKKVQEGESETGDTL